MTKNTKRQANTMIAVASAHVVRQETRRGTGNRPLTKHEHQADIARELLKDESPTSVVEALVVMVIDLFSTSEPVMIGDIEAQSRAGVATERALKAFADRHYILPLHLDQISAGRQLADDLLRRADDLLEASQKLMAEAR